MNLQEIIAIVENKLHALQIELANQTNAGDLNQVIIIKGDIAETEKVLAKLKANN